MATSWVLYPSVCTERQSEMWPTRSSDLRVYLRHGRAWKMKQVGCIPFINIYLVSAFCQKLGKSKTGKLQPPPLQRSQLSGETDIWVVGSDHPGWNPGSCPSSQSDLDKSLRPLCFNLLVCKMLPCWYIHLANLFGEHVIGSRLGIQNWTKPARPDFVDLAVQYQIRVYPIGFYKHKRG